jgi:protein involved in polysaccharide export with SLBB domain
MSRHWAKKLAAATCVLLVVLFTSRLMPAGPQEPAKSVPSPPLKERAKAATPPEEKQAKQRDVEAEIGKMLDAYDLKPHLPKPIPDDPPPHEGAMIDEPEYVIEPPDLVLIEVLETLPGRPISGERLVRPDGTINLGFYGDVHVRGLTITQAKVKIVKHLRRFLTDEVLGLVEMNPGIPVEKAAPALIPEVPGNGDNPFKLDEEKKPKAESKKPGTVPSNYRSYFPAQRKETRRAVNPTGASKRVRLAATWQEEKKPDEAHKPIKIPLEAGGQITITIEIQPKAKEAEAAPAAEAEGGIPGELIPPEKNERVFVDVTAYNSKNYFVEGDVGSPGRLPITGNETVLDALTFAGGLISSAESKDIRLVRPARGGKPAKVYKVDLEAIQEKGDHRANYQIFPGDRLVVGRNDVVKKTTELDRLALPMQTVLNSMRQESSLLQSLLTASPQNHDAILRDLVEFWIQEMKRPEAKLDEQTLREALIKRLQIKPK